MEIILNINTHIYSLILFLYKIYIMSLHITLGSMYAGKTTKLIDEYTIAQDINKSPIIIDFDCNSNPKYDEDTRVKRGTMKNHDDIEIENVVVTTYLMKPKLVQLCLGHDIILINEAQFFNDLQKFVKYLVSNDKTVFIYGLDGDFEREPMGQILNLIPFCDSVTKIKGICDKCKRKPSIFSHRVSKNKEKVLIDPKQYIPVCRSCYNYLNPIKSIEL